MDIYTLKKKKKQALKALEKYNSLRAEVYENCQCPQDELVEQEHYYEGDYSNRAYTEYWQECIICGRRHNRVNKQHSYYG